MLKIGMSESEDPKFAKNALKLRVTRLALELGFIIAIPIVVFGLLGKYLDERFGADPIFKLAGLVLAITVTTIWLTRRFSEIFRAMKESSKQNEKSKER